MREPFGAGDTMMLVVLAFALVIAVLWIFLPFAVFGIKDRLDRMLREQEDAAKDLQDLVMIAERLETHLTGREHAGTQSRPPVAAKKFWRKAWIMFIRPNSIAQVLRK